MSVGELFYGGPETSASLTDRPPPRVRLGAHPRAVVGRRSAATCSIGARAIFGDDTWPTVVLSNHDQSRHAHRLSASAGIDDTRRRRARRGAIQLTMRGTPFLYYGEEIGLRDVEVPFDEIIDPPARRVEEGWTWWNRDGCRSPMPWTAGPVTGFTTGRPWIRFGDDADPQRRRPGGRPDSVLRVPTAADRAAQARPACAPGRPAGSPPAATSWRTSARRTAGRSSWRTSAADQVDGPGRRRAVAASAAVVGTAPRPAAGTLALAASRSCHPPGG